MLKSLSLIGFTVVSWIFCSGVFAGVFSPLEHAQYQFKNPTEEPKFHVFYTSTEMQISRAKAIIDQAPEGLYVTVGGDRGFRAASMSSKATHLLILDISPKIVRYNKINIELLKAPSLAEYKKLRWDCPFSDWARFIEEAKNTGASVHLSKDDFEWWASNVRDMNSYSYYPIPEMLNRFGKDILIDRFKQVREKLGLIYKHQKKGIGEDYLYYSATYQEWLEYTTDVANPSISVQLTEEDWTWWRKYVGNGKDWAYAQDWLKDPSTIVDMGQVIDFRSGNYFYKADLYQKLHEMALKEKISSIQIDLTHEDNVSLLVSLLQEIKLPLAVLDLDNAYDSDYMSEGPYLSVFSKFQKIADHHSILLVMNNFKDFGPAQFSTYIGFRFVNVRQWPSHFHLQEFFKKIPKELLDLINGRLYEDGEMPPYSF